MSLASEILADSAVAYWPLDETSGSTAADSSGNGITLNYAGGFTVNQSPLITTGKAVALSGGTARKLSTTAALNANGKVTLEGWIKTTQSGADGCIISCDDSGGPRYFQWRVTSTGKISIILFDTGGSTHTATGSITVNDGVRHHVVVTYDGTTIRIYVDGNEDGSGTAASFALATSNPNICIGERNSGGSDSLFLTGTFDEVAMYTQALSAARIQAHWVAGGGAPATSIKTFGGVARASIKTVEGLALASIKSTEGVA